MARKEGLASTVTFLRKDGARQYPLTPPPAPLGSRQAGQVGEWDREFSSVIRRVWLLAEIQNAKP